MALLIRQRPILWPSYPPHHSPVSSRSGYRVFSLYKTVGVLIVNPHGRVSSVFLSGKCLFLSTSRSMPILDLSGPFDCISSDLPVNEERLEQSPHKRPLFLAPLRNRVPGRLDGCKPGRRQALCENALFFKLMRVQTLGRGGSLGKPHLIRGKPPLASFEYMTLWISYSDALVVTGNAKTFLTRLPGRRHFQFVEERTIVVMTAHDEKGGRSRSSWASKAQQRVIIGKQLGFRRFGSVDIDLLKALKPDAAHARLAVVDRAQIEEGLKLTADGHSRWQRLRFYDGDSPRGDFYLG
ncbi:unnamed protein product [Prunus armeniaca]|uniref:Uncharacterized protein n=1 Tax=Prunus armeniaca TaxID=36596 RepID=A0A6J5XJ54_PRUAR|nr:unnamed protein product [Prunus armeniaca]